MKNYFFKLIGLVIGFGILFSMITKVEMPEIYRAIKQIQASDLFSAFMLVLCGAYLRALRWRNLFSNREKIKIYPFFSAIMIGNLANNFLPARGGELLRVYVLGKNIRFSKSSILATIVVERLIELFIISILLMLIVYMFELPLWIQRIALLIGIGAFLGLSTLIILYKNFLGCSSVLSKFFDRINLGYFKGFINSFVRDFMDGVGGVISRRSFLYFLFFTILIWMSEIWILWIFAKSYGFLLSFLESWFVMMFAVIASFAPIPGQIGILEFAVQSSMELLSYQGPSVIAFALSWHAMIFFMAIITGIICFLFDGGISMKKNVLQNNQAS